MLSEISVIVKNETKKLIKKFPSYDTYTVSEFDPVIKSCVNEALKEFASEPEDVKVKISLGIK